MRKDSPLQISEGAWPCWWVNCILLASRIGEGNGIPLQHSCLENPRDGGAWWAAIYGVTQSRTRLKRLSSSSSLQNRERSLTKPRPLLFWVFLCFFFLWLQWVLVASHRIFIANNRLVPNRKGVRHSCILSPCLFNFCAEYSMRNARLDEAQAGIKIVGRNINNVISDIHMIPSCGRKGRTKEPFDESVRGE